MYFNIYHTNWQLLFINFLNMMLCQRKILHGPKHVCFYHTVNICKYRLWRKICISGVYTIELCLAHPANYEIHLHLIDQPTSTRCQQPHCVCLWIPYLDWCNPEVRVANQYTIPQLLHSLGSGHIYMCQWTGSALAQAPNSRQVVTWTKDDLLSWTSMNKIP